MEIEAKFTVPDAKTAHVLSTLKRLNGYTLGAAKTLSMRDTFYDTPQHNFRAARQVLRVRQRSDGRFIVTLKGDTERRDAIHSRSEIEVTLKKLNKGHLDIAAMPSPELRHALTQIAGEQPLAPLMSIQQRRTVRAVRHARRMIGEWSSDRVQFRAGTRRRVFYELEIELKKSGTVNDLEKIAEVLAREWRLLPQWESKFARALKFLDGD
ncbi:MAG TPA: CYTH domain-containing protein [Anaerolineae bacterium]|nr:CYTH domain-containing protein [Anaerolineae bacterium]